MTILFDTYYEQCPHRRILYTAQSENQCWIVMDGVELSYMMYQGEYQPIFMCNRYCSEYGDDTYYFKTYAECERVWNMNENELTAYAESITL
jgi:hypothetical protein